METNKVVFVDECVRVPKKLLRSEKTGPYNIGSEEMISINDFVDLIADVAGKTINKVHIDGPLGVRGRNSDNTLIKPNLDGLRLKHLKKAFLRPMSGSRHG